MSHKIMQHDVQEGRSIAWHGLTRVNENLTLENCWLRSWDYLGQPVMTENGQKTPFSVLGVTDKCLVPLNDDQPDGEQIPLTIGLPYDRKSFKPVMNGPLLDILAKAIEGQGLTLESCGTVMNRGRMFLSFGLAGAQFHAAGRDFLAFLNIGNGNDKSSPLWVNTSNICTVCNNTFSMNMGTAGMIMSVKKTQNSEIKIGDMGRVVQAMLKGQKEFAKTLGQLCKIKCDENTAREFFAGFMATGDGPLATRTENIVERLVQLFKGGAGNDGNDFSDVFQAATDFFTHESASGKGDEGAAWKNFVSSEYGAGRNSKAEAWKFLTDEKLRKGVITMGKKALSATAKAAREEKAK